MLDVHPPEHGVHGVRDFFAHIFVITIGLLIALGLENAVEALHHHHQRERAEEMIRQEISQNRDALKADAPNLMKEYSEMRVILAFVKARSEGNTGVLPHVEPLFREGAIPDSAWRTASSTGALAYMKYEEVQTFSDVYKEQDLLQRTAEETLEDYLQLEPLLRNGQDPSKLSKEDAAAALPAVQRTLGHLAGMIAIGNGTLQSYKQALGN